MNTFHANLISGEREENSNNKTKKMSFLNQLFVIESIHTFILN